MVATLLKLLKNKYFIAGIVVLLLLGGSYYKGYSDKTSQVEVQQLREYREISEKLDRVYNFSVDQATKSKEDIKNTEVTLNKIINSIKGKPLSSVPCVPNKDFSDTWRQLDETLIIE